MRFPPHFTVAIEAIRQLIAADMQSVEPKITKAVFEVLSVDRSVKSRVSFGGTAPKNVRAAAQKWLKRIEKERG